LGVVLAPSAAAAEELADAKGPVARLPQKKTATAGMDGAAVWGRGVQGRGVHGAAPRILAARADVME